MNSMSGFIAVFSKYLSLYDLPKKVLHTIVGILVIAALDGCSSQVLEARATFQASAAKATATAYVDWKLQANANVSPQALLTATAVTKNIYYELKQAEDQSFVAVLLAVVALIAVILITASAVLYRGLYLSNKIRLQEKINQNLRRPVSPGH